MPTQNRRPRAKLSPVRGNVTSNSSTTERLLQATEALWTSEDDIYNEFVYSSWRRRYFNDPAGFVLNAFRWSNGDEPASYQLEVLETLCESRRICVRGPHGLGKSALSAWSILWFALTRDIDHDWKIPTTASSWRQLTKYLWPEIHKWARELVWKEIGRPRFNTNTELFTLSLKLKTGEAFALASNDHNLIEGAHAKELMYVFDESKTIPPNTWDAAEGAMSSGTTRWLSVSTPGDPEGRFYQIQTRAKGYEDWRVRHVNVHEAIAANRMEAQWVENRRIQWGVNSARFINRVLGDFAHSESDAIIPLSWVEQAVERWQSWMEGIGSGASEGTCMSIGADIARMGSDHTVFAFRYSLGIHHIERYSKEDTMQTVGRLAAALNLHQSAYAIIDAIGVGAGVYDRLRELNYEPRIESFVASEKTMRRDRSGAWGFVDKRSAAWWNMREILDPANGYDIALPPDDELTGDLTAPMWEPMSNARIRVETKKDISERIGRSTNFGDAVVQAYWDDYIGEGMDYA